MWPIRDNGVLTFWADDLAGAGRGLVWFGSRGLGLVVLLLFGLEKGLYQYGQGTYCTPYCVRIFHRLLI